MDWSPSLSGQTFPLLPAGLRSDEARVSLDCLKWCKIMLRSCEKLLVSNERSKPMILEIKFGSQRQDRTLFKTRWIIHLETYPFY